MNTTTTTSMPPDTIRGPDGRDYVPGRWYAFNELPQVQGAHGVRQLLPSMRHRYEIYTETHGIVAWTPWTNRNALGATQWRIAV